MKLTDIISVDQIAVNVKFTDKVEIFRKLVGMIEKAGCFSDSGGVLNEILKRERILSTGIGDGIAIPHCQSALVKNIGCALAILEKPVNFNSSDGKPVTIVCLVVGSTNNVSQQIRLLENISTLLTNKKLQNNLSSAATPTEVLEIIKAFV